MENEITVRISHVETRIIEVKGVIDVENICLNGKETNIIVDSDKIPVLGMVVDE